MAGMVCTVQFRSLQDYMFTISGMNMKGDPEFITKREQFICYIDSIKYLVTIANSEDSPSVMKCPSAEITTS